MSQQSVFFKLRLSGASYYKSNDEISSDYFWKRSSFIKCDVHASYDSFNEINIGDDEFGYETLLGRAVKI